MQLPNSKKFAFLLSLVLVSASLSCRGNRKASQPGNTGVAQVETEDDKVLLQLEDAKPGLTILLSEGKSAGARVIRQTIAAAQELAPAQVKVLLGRLPKLLTKKGDKTDFAFRDRSLPPPRTGKTVKHSFPPKPTTRVAPKVGGALEVTRFAPEGNVPLAPHLSVSFSQPMVAITSHEESVKNVPVKLTPEPKGQWRWVGTKTLLFDPEVRFPMATEYKVEIAKGTKSANGDVLAKAKNFKFVTPSVTMKQSYPTYNPQPLSPTIFVAFDQRIDPSAVLSKIKLEVKGRNRAVRMASEEEIKEDKTVFAMVEAQRKRDNGKRWIAFRPEQPLPKDASVSVTVAKGTPSAEGPLLTKSGQSFSFRTFAPLKIIESRCSWGGSCPPGSGFSVRFNNPLDQEDFDAETLSVSPELAGYKAHVNGQWLSVNGRTEGRTTYELTIPALIKDQFGQTLGKEAIRKFKIGDAHPQIFGNRGLSVADPSARKPSFDVHSINIKSLSVQVYRVDPRKHWAAYGRFMQQNPRQPKPAPGSKVFDKNIRLKGPADRMIDTAIDLAPALNKDGKGHAVVVAEPTNWPNRYKPKIISWVQVTDIGIDAFTDSTEMITWVTNLGDGKPLSGVDLAITHTSKKATSDKKGLATLPLDLKSPKKGEHQILVASKGTDTAILPQNTYFWSNSSGFRGHSTPDQMQWYVFDDRGMYKPGEKVQVKGWIRTHEGGEGGDVGTARGAVGISYTVYGSRNNKLGEGKAKVSRLGGFDFNFKLPGNANLGYARVELQASGVGARANGYASHGFQIQEFRRPEFEVSSEVSQGPHIVGKGADVTVNAKYYAGGPLAGAEVNWTVHSTPTNFTPPNQEKYDFGTWTPWWGFRHHGYGGYQPPAERQTFAGKTDASGKHILHMDFVSVKPPRPMSVVAEASVMDVNRQAWATSATALVHPSDYYIGLKRDRYFVEKGDPIKLTGVVVDQEGKAAVGREATVRAVRLDWKYEKGSYKEVEEDPQVCAVKASESPFECEFKTPVGGRYKIVATVTDDHKRPNQTEITTWVSGGDQPPVRNISQESVTMIPDKKEYQAGDTAKIMVQAPFFPAEAIVSIRRSGIVSSKSIHLDKATTTIEVPIQEAHVPNLYVQVDMVGSAVRVDDQGEKQPELPRRPAFAMGQLNLKVPPTQRTLSVKVTPAQSKLDPASQTSIAIEVKDAKGKAAAGAELTAFVVDEAVLALSSYKTPDPIATMYRARHAGAADYHQRQWVKLAKPDPNTITASTSSTRGSEDDMADASAMPDRALGGMAANEPAPPPSPSAAEAPREESRAMPKRKRMQNKSGEVAQAQGQAPIAVRKNFDALAVFAPAVRTDANGKAKVSFKVPDNLTRYRIIVVAAAGKNHFGKGESSMTARKSLMVRPSPPRFLNFGDKFELPVVVQNQTDKPMDIQLAVRATNTTIARSGGKTLTVPANDRAEVRFPAAAEMAGVARFQVVAVSGRYEDANEFSLPVWTPATTEAFASYGEIDSGAMGQPIRMPGGVVKNFGGLDISLSSTQLQAVTDAFLYLVQYPYECSEQTASRIMGVAALRDVLSAFEAKDMPTKAEIESTVARDIKRLAALQNWDGGFAFWLRGHESWPYISIHAAHALTRAKDKGFDVPASMLNKSKTYLRRIEQHIPHYYSLRTRRMLISYALYVRKRMGDLDLARAKKLVAQAGLPKLSMESIGWLMSVLHGDSGSRTILSKMHRYLDNKVSETASAANWVDGYNDDAHLVLHSSRRADAILLESLIEDKKGSDLIPKVVRGLLAHRKRGRWGNTQENVFVLQAMDTYFNTFEKVTPDFVARMWLGDKFAGEQAFRGRSTDRHQTHIPMQILASAKNDQKLVIGKQGKGRLYYRVGMTYAPKDLNLPPADHGFAIERSYEAVNDPGDVVRQKDGSWKVKAGAQVRVRLTMVAENRRYHVALVDALPAGLEAMNPALAVTGTVPQDPQAQKNSGPFWWWRGTWFEHQNMRDERVEAFSSLLWSGVHKYDYVTRATTPGRFIVPPAKAEEMYSPETFGRSASDVLIVE
jgi:uncharacterized protein YfaS (alpha-2-macroglobulin family)